MAELGLRLLEKARHLPKFPPSSSQALLGASPRLPSFHTEVSGHFGNSQKPRAQTPGRTRPGTTVSRITFKIRRGGNKKTPQNKYKLHMELQSAAGAASGC